MSQTPNYYDILGVFPVSTDQEIKTAYRRLVRAYHPDVNASPTAIERFHRVQEAYAVLGQAESRQQYNRSLQPQPSSLHTAAAGYKAYQESERKQSSQSVKEPVTKRDASKETATVNQFFDQVFTMFSSGTAAQQEPKEPIQQRPRRQMAYYEGKLVVTREDLQARKVFKVPAQTRQGCYRCSQTGRVNGKVCAACRGAKKIVVTEEILVRLPNTLQTSGLIQAEVVQPIGGSARLDVTVVMCPSSLRREGSDVIYELSLSVPQLVLGGVFNCPGADGGNGFKVTVPSGMSPDQKLRLPGKGLTFSGKTGDYYVQVRLLVPKKLKAKEQALYRELLLLSES